MSLPARSTRWNLLTHSVTDRRDVSSDPLPLLPLILENVPPGLRRALAQEGIPCRDYRPGPPEGRFLLCDCRALPRPSLDAGQVVIDTNQLRQGSADDPFEALLDERTHDVRWDIGGFSVTETVARIDKRQVRRGLLARLRRAIEGAGGIWLRTAAFPYPYRSVFNFRIDHDDYHAADFDATLKALAGCEAATTHFVTAAGFQQFPAALARLRGMDIGSHGYWHHTYKTAEENIRNIFRGIEALQTAGIEPFGFAAPHGRFNGGLLAALAALGIPYSSEFGLAYDETPFFLDGGRLLQIPIHPICLGVVLEAAVRRPGPADRSGEAVRATLGHWEQHARTCSQAGEPVFLYGHPTGRLGRYPEVLRRALQIASGLNATWKTNFRELHAWWRARAGARLSVRQDVDGFTVVADSLAAPYRLGIEYWQGEEVAVIPMDGPRLRFSPAALNYEQPATPATVRPVGIDRPEGLRGRIRRWIDWERVTPVDEIPWDNWQNVTKRTLRRMVDS